MRVWLNCFLPGVVVVAAVAQTPDRTTPSFEIASVKENTSGESRARMQTLQIGRAHV